MHPFPRLPFGIVWSASVDFLQQPGHVVGHGAHGLEAFGVKGGLGEGQVRVALLARAAVDE